MTDRTSAEGRTSDVVIRLLDELTDERAAAVLRHENRFLRARLEGRGRVEADPRLRAELDRAQSRIEELARRVGDLTGQRDQLAERLRRLETEARAGQLLADRLTGFEQRLARQAETFERFEHSRRIERDQRDARQAAAIDELEQRLEAADTARQDLVLLLRRIGTTPLRALLRRRAGYRAIEDRWLP